MEKLKSKKCFKGIFLFMLSVSLIFVVSCGTSNKSLPMTENSLAPEMSKAENLDGKVVTSDEMVGTGGEQNFGRVVTSDSKIVKSSNLGMETSKFKEFVEAVKTTVLDNGGSVENYSSYVSEKKNDGEWFQNANFTLRVPKDKYEIVLNDVKNLGTVINENEYVENQSETYADIETRLKVKKAEEARILELSEKAEKVEDIVAIEKLLSEIRTTIEQYETSLKNIDKMVDYSTITLNVNEVIEKNSVKGISNNLLDDIASSFIESINFIVVAFQNLLIFIAFIIVPLGIISVLFVIVKFFRKRFKKKKQEVNDNKDDFNNSVK